VIEQCRRADNANSVAEKSPPAASKIRSDTPGDGSDDGKEWKQTDADEDETKCRFRLSVGWGGGYYLSHDSLDHGNDDCPENGPFDDTREDIR